MIRKVLTNCVLLALLVVAKTYGNDNELLIKKSGYVVEILNFKDGDKLYMFDFTSGVHVLSKTRNTIDFYQIPEGEYIIIDSNDRIIVLEKTSSAIYPLVFSNDMLYVAQKYFSNFDSTNQAINMLGVVLEEDEKTITIRGFKDGDKLKLFQTSDSTHILTKTYNTIDFNNLDDGGYFIEKSNTAIKVYIEKRNGTVRLQNSPSAAISAL